METPTKKNDMTLGEDSDKTIATPDTKMATSTSDTMMESSTPEKTGANVGGRKKSRKVNPALKSWVKFVKKIQHEEKLTYPEAMKRASKRKSEWQRGGADITNESDELDLSKDSSKDREMMGGRRRHSRKQRGGEGEVIEDDEVDGQQMGGRRRRSRKQRGGEGEVIEDDEVDGQQMGGRRRRSRRSRSRKQRGGNVADFDSDWKQYGKVGGRRRTRRHRR
jgi:hypothetical protein